MPKPPSRPVPTSTASLAEIRAYNEEALGIYNAHQAKCPECGRGFEPDRLPVHMRGCKGPRKPLKSSSSLSSSSSPAKPLRRSLDGTGYTPAGSAVAAEHALADKVTQMPAAGNTWVSPEAARAKFAALAASSQSRA